MSGTKRREFIRGIQFDEYTLQLADALCERRGISRSQLLRWLVQREAAADAQLELPGLGDSVAASR